MTAEGKRYATVIAGDVVAPRHQPDRDLTALRMQTIRLNLGRGLPVHLEPDGVERPQPVPQDNTD